MLTWKAVPNSPELSVPCVVRIEQFAPNHSVKGGFYYWWSEGDVGLFGQFPECLHLDYPDTDWRGPFETEQEAINDCREHDLSRSTAGRYYRPPNGGGFKRP